MGTTRSTKFTPATAGRIRRISKQPVPGSQSQSTGPSEWIISQRLADAWFSDRSCSWLARVNPQHTSQWKATRRSLGGVASFVAERRVIWGLAQRGVLVDVCASV